MSTKKVPSPYEIEKELTNIQSQLLIRDGVIVISTEAYEDYGQSKSTKYLQEAKTLGKNIWKLSLKLYDFSKQAKDFILNKIVSEKFIVNKLGTLKMAVNNFEHQRGFVSNVPTFDEQRKRFLNIIKVVEYIEKISNTSTISINDFPSSDSIMDNIEQITGGAIYVSKAKAESSYRNLAWRAPQLTSFEITQSDWVKDQNMEQIKGLALTCKFSMSEKLIKVSEKISARCKQFIKEHRHAMSTYDPDNENDESERTNLESELAGMYSFAYSIEKIVRQVLTQGIQKEINTFSNIYLSRLSRIKAN